MLEILFGWWGCCDLRELDIWFCLVYMVCRVGVCGFFWGCGCFCVGCRGGRWWLCLFICFCCFVIWGLYGCGLVWCWWGDCCSKCRYGGCGWIVCGWIVVVFGLLFLIILICFWWWWCCWFWCVSVCWWCDWCFFGSWSFGCWFFRLLVFWFDRYMLFVSWFSDVGCCICLVLELGVNWVYCFF